MRNPYVTGSYVTQQRHYGRRELLDFLLHGESRAYWVVGSRRIGKTSLLRQLEILAAESDLLVPLYWDMQGGDTMARLGQYLLDAVCDGGERFDALGVSTAACTQDDALVLLNMLRRAATRAGRQLLLLCDETEALVKVAEAEPEAAQRLHNQLTAAPGLRVVMTSTRAIYRLHDVCRNWPTSPFLFGFDISQTLGSLRPDEAHSLILQLETETPVRAEPDVVDTVSECTNDHPYLIQLLCSRLFQADGWLRAVTDDDLQVDPVLRSFFQTDFASLTEADRRVVWAVYDAAVMEEKTLQTVVNEHPVQLHQRVHNLESLGFLRRVYGQLAIGNQFLANWLATERNALVATPVAAASETAIQTALAVQQAQEASFLVTRLNARRDRLVKLESLRAGDLVNVSPQVLAEIAQVQDEIRHLRRLLDEIWPGG